MSDAPRPLAPEPEPDDQPQRPAAPEPAETPRLEPQAHARPPEPLPARPAPAPTPPTPAASQPKPLVPAGPTLQRKPEPAAPTEPARPEAKAEPEPARAEQKAPRLPEPLESSVPAAARPAAASVQRQPEPPHEAPSTPALKPVAKLATPLEAIGRRVAQRLERTETALSPWTQQTLRLQQPAPPAAEPKAGGKTPAEPARAANRLGSLALRVQRREQAGTTGTFGRLAGGVERAERFAGRVAAHFPAIAAKYEPPAEPEAGAPSQPPAASGPIFTYYPEGVGGGSASSQPTMTAAEVLQRFGGATTSAPVQRAPAAAAPAKPAAPPTPPTRDARRLRRRGTIEEVAPQASAATPVAREEPPAPAKPAAPTPPVQRRPEPAAAQRKTEPAPTPPAEAAPRRRRSHSEEVSTPSAEAPIEPPAEPKQPPPAPASNQPGPLRWDHLTNVPPSIQRQLERVQQRLAEQAGQDRPQPTLPDTLKPFHPRNPNPPPPRPPEAPRTRPAPVAREPETPVAFGPDLQPRPASVQRQAQPPAAPARPAAQTPPAQPPAKAPDEGQPAEPLGFEAELEQLEPAEIPTAPELIQRSPEPDDRSLRDQALPLVTPRDAEPAPEALPVAEPEAPPASIHMTEAPPAVQRSPEPAPPAPPAAPAEQDMPLRQPAARVEPQPTPETDQAAPPATIQRTPAAADSQRSPAKPVTPPAARPTAEIRQAPPASAAAPSQPSQAAEPTKAAPEPPVRLAQQPLILRQPEPAPTPTESQPPAERVDMIVNAEPARTELDSQAQQPPAPPEPPAAAIDRPAVDQPLILRQPEPAQAPASPGEAAPGEARPASPNETIPRRLAETPPALPAQAPAPAPLERAAEPARPTEQPLVLRQPDPAPQSPPPSEGGSAVTPASQDEALQRRLAEKPAVEPTAAPRQGAQSEPPTLAAREVPAAEIQRSPLEDRQQPLPLREPAPETPAPLPSEPVAEAGLESPAPSAPPAIQRQAAAADELPLRNPPPVVPAVDQSAAPEPPQPGIVQRQPERHTLEQSLPLRALAEAPGRPAERPSGASTAIERPARSEPAPDGTAFSGRPAAIQRQPEAPGGPGVAMPLREPTQRDSAPPASKQSALPQLSLGSQIYARGVKDARMNVMGPLATNLRRSIQRRPEPRGQAYTQTLPVAGPPPITGLARSTTGHTSVLPQARVQRAADEAAQGQGAAPGMLLAATAASEPAGTLPLAPPALAPEKPADVAPGPSTRPAATTVQRLPLAPVIQREGEANSERSVVAKSSASDRDGELDDLLKQLEKDEASASDDDQDDDKFDLDDLADKLLPYIKRMMAVERERQEPF